MTASGTTAVGTVNGIRIEGKGVALGPERDAGAPAPVSVRGESRQPWRRAVATGEETGTEREWRAGRARLGRGAETATERGTARGGAGAGRGGGTERGGKEPREEKKAWAA